MTTQAKKRIIFEEHSLDLTIQRLCEELIENHVHFDHSAIIGLQPRGIFLAQRIHDYLENQTQQKIKLGFLDITFSRDDIRHKELDIIPNPMKIDFSLENQKIILIDDVLYTGRTIRAALDAMLSFGRPSLVELLVLINRKYTRELPIEPKYVGRSVNTLIEEKVLVELKEQGHAQDNVWLL